MAVRFFGSKATPPRDDSLQIPGAIVAPSDGPSPVELVDAGRAPHGLGVVRDQYERKIRKSPTIRMVPSSVMVGDGASASPSPTTWVPTVRTAPGHRRSGL